MALVRNGTIFSIKNAIQTLHNWKNIVQLVIYWCFWTVDTSSCTLDAPRGSIKAKATSVCITSAMAAAQKDYYRITGHCMAAYLQANNLHSCVHPIPLFVCQGSLTMKKT